MAVGDPVIERIAAYPWPRGGVQARRVRGGYTLVSARTGAPVARLKPLPSGDRVEVLWWRRDAWGPAGPFGAVLPPCSATRRMAGARHERMAGRVGRREGVARP